jgi:hypothetical protein
MFLQIYVKFLIQQDNIDPYNQLNTYYRIPFRPSKFKLLLRLFATSTYQAVIGTETFCCEDVASAHMDK